MTKKTIEQAYEELRQIIDGGSESFTHEDAVQYLKDKLAQPEQEKERCVGCEACIDTACGRDECPKGWPKAAQPEQEPVEWGVDWGPCRDFYQFLFANSLWFLCCQQFAKACDVYNQF